jgi:4-methyl-5(b-hydroxyethyl)-thiazole monophosphate biosynthesis
MKAIIPLAEGFEEIEAVSIIDVLRRAEIEVTTAYLDANPVRGAHDIAITADVDINSVKAGDFKWIILPGGMPGSANLKKNEIVISLIKQIFSSGGYAAAICAAPIVLAEAGILADKRVTCYPGYEKELGRARLVNSPVVVDGKIITGKGAGCAIPFALQIAGIIKSSDVKNDLKERLQVYWKL